MKFNLNLASRRYVNKRALNYSFNVIFGVLFIILIWGVNSLRLSQKSIQFEHAKITAVRQQHQGLLGGPTRTLTSQERAQLEKEAVVVRELLYLDAFRWTKLLDRMENLIPKGVSLSGFTPDYTKKSLTLNGQAKDLAKMRLFLDRLLKKDDFKEVYLKSHSRIKVRDYADIEQPAISFTLQLEGVF